MNFSHQERRDMIECYILSNKNATEAANEYFRRYLDRRQPCFKTFKRLYDNLGQYGSFDRPRKVCGVAEDTQINVLASIHGNASTSTRQIAEEVGVAQRTVVKVLKIHKFHPYKLSVSHSLHPGDEESRMIFCNWFISKCTADPQFPFKVLWTDETRFTNCGMFNRHNEHIWAQENPHHVEQRRHQVKFGFNVWCGVIGSNFIGPYIFEETLTGEKYLQFLRNQFRDLLDNVDLQTRSMLQWYQHDGAPPHNHILVRNHLDMTFPNAWIGRNGAIAWPARSPDLSVLDFFVWGTLKNIVYKRTYQSSHDLKVVLLESIRSIDGRSVRKATNSILKRCVSCVNKNGGLFEHL